jgi:enoyl-CoA hydratase/carnithine racemase
MAKNLIEIENDVFSCKQTDDVALVTLNQDANELLTNNEVRDAFLSTFSTIDDSLKIRGVVITNSSKLTGDTNLKRLITYISEALKYDSQKIAIQRFKNSMAQLVNLFINITKPTVAALNGDIGEGLFAISLACDFRYATPNTTFHLPTVKLGLPTTGILAFYLVHYIGLPRSIDILFTKTSLSAPEVHDLGLLTDVTTDEELINRCIEKLNDISQCPSYGISAMKRILRPDTNEINKHIDRAFEAFILNLNMIKKSTV